MPIGKRRLKRDFGAYAQLEAMNVVFVPAFALWFGWPRTLIEAIALGVAIIAVAGLLVVGTIYWRAVDLRLKAKAHDEFTKAMQFADRAERPTVLATVIAAIMTVGALTAEGWTQSVIVTAIMTLLAMLEYVNYYHAQLQIFDNLPDFRRFLATGRLKRAHMARDLAIFRSNRR